MKILEGKTTEQALKYFEEARTIYSTTVDKAVSEVYAMAYEWRVKNVSRAQWRAYPLHEIAISLIRNEL